MCVPSRGEEHPLHRSYFHGRRFEGIAVSSPLKPHQAMAAWYLLSRKVVYAIEVHFLTVVEPRAAVVHPSTVSVCPGILVPVPGTEPLTIVIA